MNGIDRKILIKKDKIRLTVVFSKNCPLRVKNKMTPSGRPITKPKNPAKKVIIIVSQVPFKSRLMIVSDITDFFNVKLF